jgi:CheY-like chemotaxis protein/anti-sigma regulatory factor (Ser/Thr protein kinase)
MQTILIVDDSDVERRLAAALIMRNGQFRVEFAENGLDALATLRRFQSERELPRLVLTDLVMPEMDGLELVKTIRECYPQVPVVLMTAYGNEVIANDALRFGAASYVPKAQQSERLLATMEQVLARCEADQGRQHLMECMQGLECSFLLDSDPAMVRPLVDFAQQALCGVPLTDVAGRIRIAIALEEALLNAVYHGMLKVSGTDLAVCSVDRRNCELPKLVKQTLADPTTKQRKIVVEISISAFEAKFVIRDRGTGFDPVVISSGDGLDRFERGRNRGLTLIRSLADEVRYNEVGNEVTLLKRRDQRTVSR